MKFSTLVNIERDSGKAFNYIVTANANILYYCKLKN